MRLNRIRIQNYRSIELTDFAIDNEGTDHTYTLIGINEAGKSSFLTAISLLSSNVDKLSARDFFDPAKPLLIEFNYDLSKDDQKILSSQFLEKGFSKELNAEIVVESAVITVVFDSPDSPKKIVEKVNFSKSIFSEYTLADTGPIKKIVIEESSDFNMEEYFTSNFPNFIGGLAHKITFWKSESKYLINDQISLETFAANPKDTSLPLYNCFMLSGISDISKTIAQIKSDPSAVHNLQEKLSDSVTSHIKNTWPNHPIKIIFQIDNMLLSFLVEDNGVKYSSKTTEQRSDGFRQFISFLLTISAESANKQLNNTLLLLDEPETHLHPQAQEFLLGELIKITLSGNNIIIFATHANYMIDKQQLNRCYRVTKLKNKTTKLERIERENSSYSEVNYEVFDIPSSDYHNELYGFIEENNKPALDNLTKDRNWKNKKSGTDDKVSLSKYIRHSIHHPENHENTPFTPKQLSDSIELLRKIKYS